MYASDHSKSLISADDKIKELMKQRDDARLELAAAQTLITELDEYIILLGAEHSDLVGIASIHHWKSHRIEAGNTARCRIAEARAAIASAKATP